jgi:antitoxin component YwqK of YwqJK toxin-antitoxin module
MNKILFLSFINFIGFYFPVNDNEDHLIKFNDAHYKYEIEITNDDLKNKSIVKEYFWFKSQQIHKSVGDYNGKLLNGMYVKSYKSNQLAEKGTFKMGLKVGEWFEWYENGKIQKMIHWNKGLLDGDFIEYFEDGRISLTGKFNKGIKDGIWIDYLKKDTTYYSKGLEFNQKPKNKLNRLFNKLRIKKDSSNVKNGVNIGDKKKDNSLKEKKNLQKKEEKNPEKKKKSNENSSKQG